MRRLAFTSSFTLLRRYAIFVSIRQSLGVTSSSPAVPMVCVSVVPPVETYESSALPRTTRGRGEGVGADGGGTAATVPPGGGVVAPAVSAPSSSGAPIMGPAGGTTSAATVRVRTSSGIPMLTAGGSGACSSVRTIQRVSNMSSGAVGTGAKGPLILTHSTVGGPPGRGDRRACDRHGPTFVARSLPGMPIR